MCSSEHMNDLITQDVTHCPKASELLHDPTGETFTAQITWLIPAGQEQSLDHRARPGTETRKHSGSPGIDGDIQIFFTS